MAGDILKVKNCIPPLSINILLRSRIAERLESFLTTEEGFTRKLTLVSAPAGFGKTTAIRGWLKGRENDTAWVSLDAEDNDPERFWTYLLSALQNLCGSIGRGPMELLQSRGVFTDHISASSQILTPLLNDLFSLEIPSFLVIDDYHLINEKNIHQDLVFFIENLPPTLHLVVTTRSDPPWPLSSWRAKHVMMEIRMADLRFSEEEAAKYFEIQNSPELKETQLNTLYSKTEGWITGLKLAAYSLASSQDIDSFINLFAGCHRHVLLFLSEEVFNSQSDDKKDFLMLSSILNRFSASLCDAVTGRNDSDRMLESLERENLFIVSLDEEGLWFRYHPLFTDLLQHSLKKHYPDLINKLHEKAGKWYLEAGEAGEAVRHIINSGNELEAGRILHDHYNHLLLTEGPGMLNRSLKSMVPEYLERFPRLLAHMALFKLIETGREDAEIYIDKAEKLNYEDNQENEEYKGILYAIKAYFNIFTSNFNEAMEYAQKALELLPANNYYWRMNVAIYLGDAALFSGNPAKAYPYYREAHNNIKQKAGNRLLILTSAFKIATSLYYLGRINEAEELIREGLLDAREKGLSGIPRIGLLWALLGEILREKGILDEAERCIERGLLYSEPEKPCLGWNLIFKIALNYSREEFEQALGTVREAELLNSEVQLPLFVTAAVERWKCRLLLDRGDSDKALALLSASGIEKSSLVKGGQEWRYLVLARLLIDQGSADLSVAGKILENVEEKALQGEYVKLYLETLLVRAMFEERKKSPVEAEEVLMKALHKGLKHGYFQTFKDSAGNLSAIFSRITERNSYASIAGQDELAKYIKRIMLLPADDSTVATDMQQPKVKKAEQLETTGSDLIEALTNRELEVLGLIDKGLSNEAIAKELFLSLGTVKWHTTNIYGKLGVRRRTEAVAQARKLKLIS
jgi:LuxR family transcriptional regulator, maltose regulon positive regulatory protein